MGSRGQREAEYAIAACRPFSNSTGSLKGTRGSTRILGWLEQHTEARRIRELLSRATYVVWSYGTPIAFVSEDEEGGRTAYYVDESHSRTTSHHQTIARVGMGEYETIGSGPWSRTQHGGALRAYRERQPRRQPVPADSPGYQLGRTEDQQQATLQRLLDPRYADPNWVPGRDPEADREAEMRDVERIAREGVWML
jgi:hypothetical protein